MRGTKMDLSQIKVDLRSDTLRVKQTAMQHLMFRAKEDPGISADALDLFRSTLEIETDPWTVAQAAAGITMLAGPIEGRNAWLRLLHHPLPNVVGHAASNLTDPYFGPILMDLLQNRSEIPIRGGALHALGRMRFPAAFPVLIAYLADPECRELTIRALSMYGDARAIPYLEPYLQDTTEAAQRDERGATICIYHLADDAIRYLRAEALRRV